MKVSIITVVYNNADTVGSAVESILKQDYPHIEYIVVDGGSTDGTIEIIQSYGARISQFVSEPDKGIYDAMNKGLRMATGDIIGILNSDDLYADTQVISKVVDTFQKHQVQSVYGDLLYVDKNDINKVVRYWKSYGYKRDKFLYGWMPPHPTFFVRKEVYKQFGLFDLAFTSAADYELMLRFLYKYNVSSAYLPKVLVRMRTGGKSNESLNNRMVANREDLKAWHKNDVKPYFFTLWLKPIRKIPQFVFKGYK